jgi:putative flippase GtrA
MPLKDRLPDNVGAKAIKYSMVSVVAVIVTQVVILICVEALEWPWVLSNFVAVTIGCIPSYTLNRAWVWQKRGKSQLTREVLPFWIMALIGLIFSSILVALADQWTDAPIAVNIANLAAFGILWVAKFWVLDAVLFKVSDEIVDAVEG